MAYLQTPTCTIKPGDNPQPTQYQREKSANNKKHHSEKYYKSAGLHMISNWGLHNTLGLSYES